MRKVVVVVAVLGAALALPAVASAETTLSSGQVLRVHKCDTTDAVTGWTSAEGDSPLDTNSKAFVFDVGTGGADGNCVVLQSRKSVDLSRGIAQMHNLSFDFKESAHVGAGAPRLSVVFGNGLVAYLAAFYCNQPLAASSGTWGRADFTGSTTTNSAPCTIWDSNGQSFSSTGTQSAWQVYATAHPGLTVQQVFLVGDETGHYVIDRLTLGTGWMYDRSRFTGKYCDQTESRC